MTRFRFVSALVGIAMTTAGCNAILGNDAHGLDSLFDANDDGVVPDSTTSGQEGGAVDRAGDAGDATTTTARDAAKPGALASDSAPADDAGAVAMGLCAPGPCAPNDCQNGTWGCSDGGRVCLETSALVSGTPCAVGGDAGAHVCNLGQCVACNAGGDCSDPAFPCVQKSYDCTLGTAQCKVTGSVPDGTACGTGLYCNAGVCAACQVGAPCSPAANPCHVGTITACAAGVPTCSDQGTATAAGKTCSAPAVGSGVCDGKGTCVACTAGTQCNPNGNPCQAGVESCSAGPQCKSVIAVREGQGCGAGQICHNGACSVCDGTSCTSGCCDNHGCVTTAQTPTECGLGGGTCTSCSGPTSGAGSAICNGNVCAIACTGATPNACHGACVSFNTDDNNCGSCGHACGPPLTCNGSGQCVNTMCPTRCPSGDNCGSVATPGCATLGCGTCSGTQTCNAAAGQPGVCVCPGNQKPCGGSCVDELTSNANCGGCGTACAPGTACSAGHCLCNTSSGCPGCCSSAATCEPLASETTASCGKGGAACSGCTLNNRCDQSLACVSGACIEGSPLSCTASDGCHVPGTCSPARGTCSASPPAPSTTACFTVPHATSAQCDGLGNCKAVTCANPFVNDQGACKSPSCAGVACGGPDGAGGICAGSSGTCSQPNQLCDGTGTCVCDAGFTSCNGACVNEQTDNANCGACGNVCPASANGQGTPVCGSGTCGLSCPPNTGQCFGGCFQIC